jgi:hypothetical protein
MGRIRNAIKIEGINFSHIDFDTSVTNIARGHFMSNDPDIFYNPDAVAVEVNYDRVIAANNLAMDNRSLAEKETEIDNPINIMLMNDVIEYFELSANKLDIGKGFHQNNISWMFALRHCFNENLAKDFCIKLFQIKGIFDYDRFEKFWSSKERDVSDPVGFGTIMHLAKEGGFEFRNKGFGLFDKAYNAKDMLVSKNTKHDLVIKEYLSEVETELNDVISKNKKVQIVSETGSGKTTFFMNQYADKGNKTIFLVPYTSMAISFVEGEKKKGNIIPAQYDKTTSDIDAAIKNEVPLIMSTYDGLQVICNKLPNCSDYTLVIDEIHNIVPVYSYRKEAVRSIINLGDRFKKVVCLTGTPLHNDVMNLMPFFTDLKTVKVKSEKVTDKRVHFVLTDDPINSITKHIVASKGNGKKTAVYYQNCDKNKELANALSYHKMTSAVINSTTKDGKQTKNVLKNQKLDVDVLIGTASIKDGINVKNFEIREIHVVGLHPVRDIQQFTNRFRNAVTDIDVYIYVSKNHYLNVGSSNANKIHAKVKKEAEKYESFARVICEDFMAIKGENVMRNTHGGLVLPNQNMTPLSNLVHCYYFDKEEKTFEIDETGIIWEVQRQLDEIECQNPYIFMQELVKYGFVYQGPIESNDKKIETGDKINYWKIAIEHFVSVSEGYKGLGNMRLRMSQFFDEHITLKSSLVEGSVKKNWTILYERWKELVQLNYKDETALKIVCEAPKSEGKYLNAVIFPLVVDSLVKNGAINQVPIWAEIDKQIVKNKSYTSDDLLAIVSQSELALCGKIYTKQPIKILNKFYELDKKRPRKGGNGNNRPISYQITGYRKPKYLPDGVISDSGYAVVFELSLKDVFKMAA